jgi:thiamine-phosphate pyrophosphorylase
VRGLYAILDVDSIQAKGLDLRAFAAALIRARPALIQLRAKHDSARDTLAMLRELRAPTRQAGVPLFANDRPDLALLADCDGVHVGQEDLDLLDVRRVAPSLAIGVSTHDLAQLERALAARPSYVAFGPVYATASKREADPSVGLDALARAGAQARAAGIPLVAIGGIDLERASFIASRADLAAVIGALLPAPGESLEQVSERARQLHSRLGGEA